MAAQTLERGENALLPPADTVRVDVTGTDLDILAFALTSARRVRTDADFVFYNQPRSPDGAIRLSTSTQIEITLDAVPVGIERIAVAVTADRPLGGSTIAATVHAGSAVFAAPAAGLTTERAAVLVEVYRRDGRWKVRSESAGWDAGFASLVRTFGVTVDDEPGPDVAPARGEGPGVAADAGRIRMVKGEDALPPERRATLDLRKREVHKALLTKRTVGCDARVVLVLDKTLSMSSLYRQRTVHRVVERMVPLATQLDSDGNLEVYLYASGFAKLPDVTVTNSEDWVDTFVHLRGRHGRPLCADIDYDKHIGGANDELPIMRAILDDVTDRQPVLVLFFTDGGFYTKVPAIRTLIAEASSAPVFWQFIGLGDNNFGVLTQLDTMTGRIVDNAGFFRVDDIDATSDARLYADVLGEFPEWMTRAAALGIIDPRFAPPSRR